MLLFVLLGISTGIRLNADVFVDLILDVRKFYSAASVIFVHPGDMYGDYGGQFILKYLSKAIVLLLLEYIEMGAYQYTKNCLEIVFQMKKERFFYTKIRLK